MSVTRFTYIRILLRLRHLIRNDHLILVILAIVAGTAAGAAVGIGMFLCISLYSPLCLLCIPLYIWIPLCVN